MRVVALTRNIGHAMPLALSETPTCRTIMAATGNAIEYANSSGLWLISQSCRNESWLPPFDHLMRQSIFLHDVVYVNRG